MKNNRYRIPAVSREVIGLELKTGENLKMRFKVTKIGAEDFSFVFVDKGKVAQSFFELLISQFDLEDISDEDAIAVIAGFVFKKVQKSLRESTKKEHHRIYLSAVKNMNECFGQAKKYELEVETEGFEELFRKFQILNQELNKLLPTSINIKFIEGNKIVIPNGKTLKFSTPVTWKRIKYICEEIERKMQNPKATLPIEISGDECIGLFKGEAVYSNIDERNLSHIFKRSLKKIKQFASVEDNVFRLK